MAVQLTHVYNQILSVLTLRQLDRIMNQRGNYDLRRLLGGVYCVPSLIVYLFSPASSNQASKVYYKQTALQIETSTIKVLH